MLRLVFAESQKASEFDKTSEATLDQVMESIFGSAGKDDITYHIGKVSIAENPAGFHSGFAGMLGTGSTVIEQQVMKELYRRINLQYVPPGEVRPRRRAPGSQEKA